MAKKNNKTKLLVIMLILLIIVTAILLYLKIKAGKNEGENNNFLTSFINEEPKEEIKIYNGTDRPIAVMIDISIIYPPV